MREEEIVAAASKLPEEARASIASRLIHGLESAKHWVGDKKAFRPNARIVHAAPRKISDWDDHLATAIPGGGRTAEETVATDREGRW
jgi:uncharacterized Ntn-hydrolase superfamily protein